MQVRINVPDRLAAEARARGVSLEMYVEEMLAQQAIGPGGKTLQESVGEAIDRIRELRKPRVSLQLAAFRQNLLLGFPSAPDS
jgi:hypothetical protein